MQRTNWLFRGSIVLVLATVAGVVLMLGFLDKSGRIGKGHVSFYYALLANCAVLALIASPLVAHVAACAWRRHDQRFAAAGLLTVAVSCGVTLWGNLTDYVAWSRLPPPTDQVTFLDWFFGMLASWGLCAVYVIAGVVVRNVRPASV
jgi:hypothetical protein